MTTVSQWAVFSLALFDFIFKHVPGLPPNENLSTYFLASNSAMVSCRGEKRPAHSQSQSKMVFPSRCLLCIWCMCFRNNCSMCQRCMLIARWTKHYLTDSFVVEGRTFECLRMCNCLSFSLFLSSYILLSYNIVSSFLAIHCWHSWIQTNHYIVYVSVFAWLPSNRSR